MTVLRRLHVTVCKHGVQLRKQQQVFFQLLHQLCVVRCQETPAIH